MGSAVLVPHTGVCNSQDEPVVFKSCKKSIGQTEDSVGQTVGTTESVTGINTELYLSHSFTSILNQKPSPIHKQFPM